jgi:hypothetical protein
MKLIFPSKIIVIFLLASTHTMFAINLNGTDIIKNCTSALSAYLVYFVAHNAGHIIIPNALLALGCPIVAGSRDNVEIKLTGTIYRPLKITPPHFTNEWLNKLHIIGSAVLSTAAIYGVYKIHNMLMEKNKNTQDNTTDESLPLVNSKQPIGLHLATLLHTAENLVCIHKG